MFEKRLQVLVHLNLELCSSGLLHSE